MIYKNKMIKVLFNKRPLADSLGYYITGGGIFWHADDLQTGAGYHYGTSRRSH
jgi:hypothetical protein